MKKAEFTEILRRITETDWPAQRIAAELGISRQALYERLRKNGIVFRDHRKKTQLEAEDLRRLYVDEQLTIKQIANRLGHSQYKIVIGMREHNIPARSPSEHPLRRSRYASIESLQIGDSIEFELIDQKMPSSGSFYKNTKQPDKRFAVRRKDAGTTVVTRTPLLNYETVCEMRDDGMTLKEISKVFRSTGKTISDILKEERH